MKNFSLVLNSRGRPHHLSNLAQSIIDTTSDLSNVEAFVGLDTDDHTLDSINSVVSSFQPLLTPIYGNRPTNLIHALNSLTTRSQGKYTFILNDDVIFQTKNWDKIAFEKLEKYCEEKGDEIVYGQTNDLSIDKDDGAEYSAFPIISQKAVSVLGFPICGFPGLGGDVGTYRIYEKIGRICPLKEIILDHVLHNTYEKVISPDQTAYEMRQLTYRNRQDWKEFDISPYVEKLQNYMDKTSQSSHNK